MRPMDIDSGIYRAHMREQQTIYTLEGTDMARTTSYLFRIACFLVFILTLAGSASAQNNELFSEVPLTQQRKGLAFPPFIRRDRQVLINPSALKGTTTQLNFFDNATFSLQLKRQLPENGFEVYTWNDEKGAEVIAVEKDGTMAMSVHMGVKAIDVQPLGKGIYRVIEYDSVRFPKDQHVNTDQNPSTPIPASEAKNDQIADVIVDIQMLWSPEVREIFGGEVESQAAATLAIVTANQGLINTQLGHRFRLVRTGQTPWSEGDYRDDEEPELMNWNTFLDRLGDDRQVRDWAENSGADLTQVLVSDWTWCGMAWQLSPDQYRNLDVFRRIAMSLSNYWCASGSFASGHEFGHNMGAHHDRFVGCEGRLYEFSCGFLNAITRVRTIMSYPTGCPECNRINYYSSPRIRIAGDVIGDDLQADNQRTLYNSMPAIAGLRASRVQGSIGIYEPREGQRILISPYGAAFAVYGTYSVSANWLSIDVQSSIDNFQSTTPVQAIRRDLNVWVFYTPNLMDQHSGQITFRAFLNGDLAMTERRVNIVVANGWLRGIVRDSDGSPLVGADLTTGTGFRKKTDDQGRFEVPMPEGQDTVQIRWSSFNKICWANHIFGINFRQEVETDLRLDCAPISPRLFFPSVEHAR